MKVKEQLAPRQKLLHHFPSIKWGFCYLMYKIAENYGSEQKAYSHQHRTTALKTLLLITFVLPALQRPENTVGWIAKREFPVDVGKPLNEVGRMWPFKNRPGFLGNHLQLWAQRAYYTQDIKAKKSNVPSPLWAKTPQEYKEVLPTWDRAARPLGVLPSLTGSPSGSGGCKVCSKEELGITSSSGLRILF